MLLCWKTILLSTLIIGSQFVIIGSNNIKTDVDFQLDIQ